ncbi:serine/threonine-protein kinase pdik1l-B-like [Ptychodera flava]|uniref:serine/threonine-protein kinase pdik1l-B-like n=1 Tax=Ptychodera flava TaxID=63121 RepID=UPI003969F67C
MTSKSLFNIVNEVLSSKYDIVKPLGRGAFGTVYLVKDDDGNKLAMKRIPWQGKANYVSAIRESRAFAITRNHAHVVELIDGYADENYAYYVMEYCDGGDLNNYLLKRPYDLELNLRCMSQMADAVSFLHHSNVTHRDLKPANILVKIRPDSMDIVKVTGFAVATTLDKRLLTDSKEESGEYTAYYQSVEGTEAFVAPEVYKKQYSFKMDIFALGVIFLAMLEREVYTYSDSNKNLMAFYNYEDADNGKTSYIGKILAENSNAVRQLDDEVTAGQGLRQLINIMIARDPEKRPTGDEIFATLREVSNGPQIIVKTGCCYCRRCSRDSRGFCFNLWCCCCILFGCS